MKSGLDIAEFDNLTYYFSQCGTLCGCFALHFPRDKRRGIIRFANRRSGILGEEFCKRHAERNAQAFYHFNGRIFLSALDHAEVGRCNFGGQRKVFL